MSICEELKAPECAKCEDFPISRKFFVKKQAFYWFRKHSEANNMEGIWKMIKRGSIILQ